MTLRMDEARRAQRGGWLGGLGGAEAEDEDKIRLAADAEAAPESVKVALSKGARDAVVLSKSLPDQAVQNFQMAVRGLAAKLNEYQQFASASTWDSSQVIRKNLQAANANLNLRLGKAPLAPHGGKTPLDPEERVVAPSAADAAYWTKHAEEIRRGRPLSPPAAKQKPAAGVTSKPKQSPGGGPLDTAARDQAIFDLASGRQVDLSTGAGSAGVSPKAVAGVALAVAGVATIVLLAVVLRPRN